MVQFFSSLECRLSAVVVGVCLSQCHSPPRALLTPHLLVTVLLEKPASGPIPHRPLFSPQREESLVHRSDRRQRVLIRGNTFAGETRARH